MFFFFFCIRRALAQLMPCGICLVWIYFIFRLIFKLGGVLFFVHPHTFFVTVYSNVPQTVSDIGSNMYSIDHISLFHYIPITEQLVDYRIHKWRA